MERVNTSGRKLYLVLWGGAAVIISAMLLINHRQKIADKSAVRNFAINGQPQDDEMTISAKNSFINLLLRGDEETPARAPVYFKAPPRTLSVYYHNSPNALRPEDFSIGPVPK